MRKNVTWNEEKGYFEIVKSEWRSSETIFWGMKAEDNTVVIPKGYYTSNEIRMAEWELCTSIEKEFEITGHIASIPNWTVVKKLEKGLDK